MSLPFWLEHVLSWPNWIITWWHLSIYKSCELELTFIEIYTPKETNIVIGCIYKHPNMNLDEFNHLSQFLIAPNIFFWLLRQAFTQELLAVVVFGIKIEFTDRSAHL